MTAIGFGLSIAVGTRMLMRECGLPDTSLVVFSKVGPRVRQSARDEEFGSLREQVQPGRQCSFDTGDVGRF